MTNWIVYKTKAKCGLNLPYHFLKPCLDCLSTSEIWRARVDAMTNKAAQNSVHGDTHWTADAAHDEFRVVELFCGAGGLSLGMKQAGMSVVGACDIVPEAVAVYNRNVGDHARVMDLSVVHDAVSWIMPLRPHLIAGGPPCQDFSSSGKREEGERASMTVAMAVICAAARPEWILMENVPRAAKSRNWLEAREILKRAGYGLSELVVNAALYGVPQRRKLLILIGRLGECDQFLNASIAGAASGTEMTLRDAA